MSVAIRAAQVGGAVVGAGLAAWGSEALAAQLDKPHLQAQKSYDQSLQGRSADDVVASVERQSLTTRPMGNQPAAALALSLGLGGLASAVLGGAALVHADLAGRSHSVATAAVLAGVMSMAIAVGPGIASAHDATKNPMPDNYRLVPRPS